MIDIHIQSFSKALKATSITKYLDTANQGKWQLFCDVELGKFVAAYLSRGILTQKTLEKISKNSGKFIKEFFDIMVINQLLDQSI